MRHSSLIFACTFFIVATVGAVARAAEPATQPSHESIPGTLVTFDMVKVPGGKVTVKAGDVETEVDVKPFWIGKTEVTWDEYDIFCFQLDLTDAEKAAGTEAKSRPSKPYGAPDFGFGHRGLPAMCVTYHAAEQYCVWLSKKMGKPYRLATEAEWLLAARGGAEGEDSPTDSKELGKFAWSYDNADGKVHPVAKREPNLLGLYDMAGNVREWVKGIDGKPVARGGSYDDDPENVGYHVRQLQTKDWNSTDPQNPKSKWWLSDGPMVGFRIARDAE